MNPAPNQKQNDVSPESQKRMENELKKFYEKTKQKKKDDKKPERTMQFSSAVSILKDMREKRSFDVIRVKEALDQKPFLFDFGSGLILVFRYRVECVDAELMLYVPAIKSFTKKIELNRFYEIASKRNFHYQVFEEKINEWILYVNRIKNISHIQLRIKDRLAWKTIEKSKKIKFTFDESWLEKSLPISNNLETLKVFCESPRDINRGTLLSPPLNVLRLEYQRQIEIVEKSGSIIKNLEYNALLHNQKMVKLYVPYFLKDIVSNLVEKLLNMNIVINRLKVFNREDYLGLLWDCTLSGFVFKNKTYDEKMLSIKDGRGFFNDEEGEDLMDLLDERKQERLQGERNGRRDDRDRRGNHYRDGGRRRGGRRQQGGRRNQNQGRDYNRDYDRDLDRNRNHNRNDNRNRNRDRNRNDNRDRNRNQNRKRNDDRNRNRNRDRDRDQGRRYERDYDRDYDYDYDYDYNDWENDTKFEKRNSKRQNRQKDQTKEYSKKEKNSREDTQGTDYNNNNDVNRNEKNKGRRRKRESKRWKQVIPEEPKPKQTHQNSKVPQADNKEAQKQQKVNENCQEKDVQVKVQPSLQN